MSDADREWHRGYLSGGARLRVLAILCVWRQSFGDQVGSGGASVADLAQATGSSTTTVRDALNHALYLEWAIAVDGTAPVASQGRRATRYAMTPAGREAVTRLARDADETIELPVIAENDRLSSSTMTPSSARMTTTPARRDRRGKPDWCTPGHGACRDCAHLEK